MILNMANGVVMLTRAMHDGWVELERTTRWRAASTVPRRSTVPPMMHFILVLLGDSEHGGSDDRSDGMSCFSYRGRGRYSPRDLPNMNRILAGLAGLR